VDDVLKKIKNQEKSLRQIKFQKEAEGRKERDYRIKCE
jgi:hypothetical protein